MNSREAVSSGENRTQRLSLRLERQTQLSRQSLDLSPDRA